ncbi:MAG: class I SAM-dependent methyltransferase [Elusimicrobia bacterium]|nr:class I SAM-dependent methyltransferase [Elusimicrobiota bacterium]
MNASEPAESYWSSTKIASELALRALSEAAPRHARGRLLDLGCGSKPYAGLFAPHVASHFGVDFGATAGLHYGEATKADLLVDGAETKLPAGSFDTILCTQVLEHVLDTEAFVAECHRLLAKGGKGIFTVPFLWQCHAEPNDFYRFTRYALQRIFEARGFRIVELRPIGGAYAALIQTKIVSIHCREISSLPRRILRKAWNLLLLPVLNWKALHLDGLFWNDKLCLNYLLVVAKD